jgi:hypothetical protein
MNHADDIKVATKAQAHLSPDCVAAAAAKKVNRE